MDSVVLCQACEKTVNACFNFCPWCGTKIVASDDLADVIDNVCARLEGLRQTHAISRIDRMDRELGELERVLSDMLLTGK